VTRPHILGGRGIDITSRPGVARLIPNAEVARVVTAALGAAGAPTPATISVILTDDDELADLNVAHLGHEGPTDVLSFPMLPPEAFPPHAGQSPAADLSGRHGGFVLPPRARPHLGDIAISVERAVAQATEGRGGHAGDRRWAPADELRLLLTHGALHVCGWDHAEPAEETAMRALERRLLGDVRD
jgi:probable rRNA maturation factor